MNILAVDDEQFALIDLHEAIKEALPNSTVSCFDSSEDALDFAKNNHIDIAFLDINMGGMNGLHLAAHLKEIYGDTNIIFVTGHSEYALDAFALHASGYILKPIDANAVHKAVNHLNRPVMQRVVQGVVQSVTPPSDKTLYVQTFGNFEVFADGKPVSFARSKTKELFAYLIYQKGALCTNNEIIAVLWDIMSDSQGLQSHLRHLVADLFKTLKAVGSEDVLFKKRGVISIVPDKLNCDMYEFCAGKNVNNYRGEFMMQYSWAEFKNAFLLQKYIRKE